MGDADFFVCCVCWMSGFRDPWCCFRCFVSVRVKIVNIWCGAEMTEKKHAPETWLDWRNYKGSPFKGSDPKTRSSQTVKTFPPLPLWRLGHVGNWPSTCWTLPGNGWWKLALDGWIAKLLWGDVCGSMEDSFLGGGFKYFFFNLGKWSNLTFAYFSNGLVQAPTSFKVKQSGILSKWIIDLGLTRLKKDAGSAWKGAKNLGIM